MRVFVTDGENRAALAVTRSLGRAGHHVVVGDRHSPSLAQTSRYCAARSVYPDPVSESDAFVDHLAAVVRDRAIDVLLPVADITTFLVTRHRDRFAPCAVPFADADIVERAANKVDLARTAMRLGVPVPRTVVVDDPARIPEHDLGFPLVIKPRQSKVRTAAGWVSSNVSYAADAEELLRDVASRPRHHFPVMLQERIVGPGIGVFACYHEGRPVALFGHRRIRERPPWGGVSVLSESVPLCPLARDYATALLDEIGWHGVAMVEFKRDLRDGVPKLMEINGRFWGSLQLAIDAGVDFPGLLVQSVSSGRFEAQAPYRIGVRNRWFWGDVDSLLLSLFGNGGPPGRTDAGRARALLSFMRFRGRNLHYDNPKWDDMRPWFFETYRRFETVAQSLAPAAGPREQAAVPVVPAATRSARARLHRRIVASLDRVGLDRRAWNALAGRSGTSSVFQTYEWTESWLATFGDLYKPCLVTVADASGVRGVAPFVVETRPAGERVIRFLGDGRADYLDLLAGDGDPLVVGAMVDALREEGDWDVLELNNIPAGSRTAPVLQTICAAAGFRVLTDDQYPCPTLVIEGREEEVRRIANKPSLRRRTNYFERSGRLVCRDLRTASDVEPHLDAFFDQHVTRWGGNGLGNSSLFVDLRNRIFYRELTRRLTGTDWLLFSVVEFNNRPIAFHYGFDYNGSVIWYKPSFDVAFEHYSPGIVMVRHLIGYALEERRRELDFTVGDEPFKRRFTNDVRKTVRVQVFRDQARYYWECSKRELVGAVRKLAR